MTRKLSVLRACRRVLRPGRRVVFFTIQPTPGLAPAQRRRANELGPPGNAVRTSYSSLLRSAGLDELEVVDVTRDYERTQRRWIAATDRHEVGIRAAIGDDAYDELVVRRRVTMQAIEDGLLSRFRYLAARPRR